MVGWIVKAWDAGTLMGSPQACRASDGRERVLRRRHLRVRTAREIEARITRQPLLDGHPCGEVKLATVAGHPSVGLARP